jgi:hypothetical protein
MIVYLANKTRFRADTLSNRIEQIVHESFQGALGKSVGASDVFRVPALAIRSDDTLVVRTKKWATRVSPLPNLAELPDHFTAKPGFFLAQVVGESMSRRIPNGSWCLFREVSDGSRNGKVVIVQSRDIQDPYTGGQYTVKIYRSEKTTTEDSWSHRSIRLEPILSVST